MPSPTASLIALVISETDDKPPMQMEPAGGDGTRWTIELRVAEPETDRIRLVASTGGSVYYGDVSTRFTLADQQNP